MSPVSKPCIFVQNMKIHWYEPFMSAEIGVTSRKTYRLVELINLFCTIALSICLNHGKCMIFKFHPQYLHWSVQVSKTGKITLTLHKNDLYRSGKNWPVHVGPLTVLVLYWLSIEHDNCIRGNTRSLFSQTL